MQVLFSVFLRGLSIFPMPLKGVTILAPFSTSWHVVVEVHEYCDTSYGCNSCCHYRVPLQPRRNNKFLSYMGIKLST